VNFVAADVSPRNFNPIKMKLAPTYVGGYGSAFGIARLWISP
jgi:hypothetical protein